MREYIAVIANPRFLPLGPVYHRKHIMAESLQEAIQAAQGMCGDRGSNKLRVCVG